MFGFFSVFKALKCKKWVFLRTERSMQSGTIRQIIEVVVIFLDTDYRNNCYCNKAASLASNSLDLGPCCDKAVYYFFSILEFTSWTHAPTKLFNAQIYSNQISLTKIDLYSAKGILSELKNNTNGDTFKLVIPIPLLLA